MSLIVQVGTGRHQSAIFDPSCRSKWGHCGLEYIPQEARDCSPQAKIDISEEPHQYIVSSELPGVILKNLWVYIEGRTLAIYAGVTGEKQGNGEYRYTKKLIGGIRGETTLPEQAFRRPAIAEFGKGVLRLVFPKQTEEFLEQIDFTRVL